MRRLDSTSTDFQDQLTRLTQSHGEVNSELEATVANIVAEVAARGDDAVLEYTARFDKLEVASAAALEIPSERLHNAYQSISQELRDALVFAADRIRSFHEHQRQDSWDYRDDSGNLLGQKVTPLGRVGLYVPGGKASYPSSVLMNAIPAKVAGVPEIIMVVPAPGGELNDLVLAAAQIAGVDRVFTIGGAQAVAALTYGTATVPAVDKIVGPGNMYVATAKRQVFGRVGIDMVAGPSEILVICDGSTDPDWVAMDMFSQAEHDENAQALLLCPDEAYLDAVEASIERLLPTLEREAIVRESLSGRGALILTRDIGEAIAISNQLAPEHLELSVANPELLIDAIENAGAIFMGAYTSEALGDYCAGPNHVLPTSGSARFSSPLGVYDFQKRSSLIQCSEQGTRELGEVASILAHGEALQAHALSATLRLGEKG
ncbi:MAG: histidinol dehydrogenase [Halioglobus sp.]